MGREPAPFRGSGSQGSDPPAGGYVGKASRAPLVLKEFTTAFQADSSRSDISCGATSRSRNTISQRSPGFAPGAPPALPISTDGFPAAKTHA